MVSCICGPCGCHCVFQRGYRVSQSRQRSLKGTRLTLWASAEGKIPDSHFRKTGKARYADHQPTFGFFFWVNEGDSSISLSGALSRSNDIDHTKELRKWESPDKWKVTLFPLSPTKTQRAMHLSYSPAGLFSGLNLFRVGSGEGL